MVDDDADDRDRHQNARTQRGFVTKLVELVEVHGGYADMTMANDTSVL